jgi:6-pyruvoyl-tetrahydropterin synthase
MQAHRAYTSHKTRNIHTLAFDCKCHSFAQRSNPIAVMSKSLHTELLLKFDFVASHSLSVREDPHPHIWKIEAAISGSPVSGMIINLPEARAAMESIIAPLTNTYLNDAPTLTADAKAAPTCESLGAFFFSEFERLITEKFHAANPTLALKSIQVTLCEMNGFEWGAAKLVNPNTL